jgi:hypothetical protein
VDKNCRRLPEDESAFTVFILPGDVGSDIHRLESVFKMLTNHYDAVIYVPGNHEAWRRGIYRPEEVAVDRMAVDSVEKLNLVLDCARACGVYVGPVRVHPGDDVDTQRSGVTILPLYSWYHAGWDREPELTHPGYLAMEAALPFAR